MDNLEKAIVFDPKWAAQCAIFLLDNPEFLPYKNLIPLTRWKQNNIINPKNIVNKYSPKNINELMIKLISEKYYSIDIYKKIKDGVEKDIDIPPVIKKVQKLPIFDAYSDFYKHFSYVSDTDYFEPDMSRLEVLWLFDEIDFNSNEDIDSFRIYGIFDSQETEPENPGLRDLWKREKTFVSGLSKVYNKEFKNGYEAFKYAQHWKRFHYVGFLLCLLI